MTTRQRSETRMTTIRHLWWTGLMMCTSLALGVWYSAWFTIGAAVGLVLCTVSVLLAMFCIRCTECSGSLLPAMAVTHDKRLLALREDISRCPRCHCDLNEQTDHADLVELLSAQGLNGTYRGVVELSDDTDHRRYELALKGDALTSFQKVLTLTPFKKNAGGSYRYFYVPDSTTQSQTYTARQGAFLVEKGDLSEVIQLQLSPALKKTLEWLSGMTEENDIMGLTLRRGSAESCTTANKLSRAA